MRHYEATSDLERRLGMPPHVTQANIAVLEVLQGQEVQAARRFERLLELRSLPAVLRVGAELGLVLGWLAEGAEGEAPVHLEGLIEELGGIGREAELSLLARRGAELAEGLRPALGEQLRQLSTG